MICSLSPGVFFKITYTFTRRNGSSMIGTFVEVTFKIFFFLNKNNKNVFFFKQTFDFIKFECFGGPLVSGLVVSLSPWPLNAGSH